MKYRALKDKKTGKWLVERIEPFFELPILLGIFDSRNVAYAIVAEHRDGYVRFRNTHNL